MSGAADGRTKCHNVCTSRKNKGISSPPTKQTLIVFCSAPMVLQITSWQIIRIINYYCNNPSNAVVNVGM